MDAQYAHDPFDDLDLNARSQWVFKGKTIKSCMFSASKQAISIQFATTAGHFIRDLDLDFVDVHMACPPCLVFFALAGSPSGALRYVESTCRTDCILWGAVCKIIHKFILYL